MGVYTVARDDFRNTRRSPVVLGVVGVFTVLVALVFGAEIDIYDDAYRAIYDASFLTTLTLPLFIATLTYLAVAGERESGTIKFSLGLPNTRGEFFLAKYVSRVAVAVAAAALAVASGFVIAAVAYTNGADPVRFVFFGGASVLYATATAGVFLAISAVTGQRTRAMFGVIAAYFVLVFFWSGYFPVVNLRTVLDFAESTLGLSLTQSTRDLIRVFSPAQAYLVALEPVYDGVVTEYESIERSYTGNAGGLAYEAWFAATVLVGWSVLAPLAGYLQFRRLELG